MKWETCRSPNFQRRSIIRKQRMESLMTTLRQFSTQLNSKRLRNMTNIKALCKRPLHLPRPQKQRSKRNKTKSKWSLNNKPKKSIVPYSKNLRKKRRNTKLKYEKKHKLSRSSTIPSYRKPLRRVKLKHQSLPRRRSLKKKRRRQSKNLQRSTIRSNKKIMLMSCTSLPWAKEEKTQNCTQSPRNWAHSLTWQTASRTRLTLMAMLINQLHSTFWNHKMQLEKLETSRHKPSLTLKKQKSSLHKS